MVFASMPVASDSRFAALPVGAHSRHFTPLARRIVRIEFTRVVLPTPGPPVMITTRQVSAVWRASLWLGASVLPVLGLAPLHRLFEIDGRVCRRRLNQRPDLRRNAFFRFPEMRQEDQGLAADQLPAAESRW